MKRKFLLSKLCLVFVVIDINLLMIVSIAAVGKKITIQRYCFIKRIA